MPLMSHPVSLPAPPRGQHGGLRGPLELLVSSVLEYDSTVFGTHVFLTRMLSNRHLGFFSFLFFFLQGDLTHREISHVNPKTVP